ncbi:hypothetical protein VNO77_22872 [Canavalia gladiata]|uniref:Uncharacterized protein n=1 Tax=Canavalia gladiata TaxID=3824 RepID=A0AAN9L6Q5_CANGL
MQNQTHIPTPQKWRIPKRVLASRKNFPSSSRALHVQIQTEPCEPYKPSLPSFPQAMRAMSHQEYFS